jgi:hypothetical protein
MAWFVQVLMHPSHLKRRTITSKRTVEGHLVKPGAVLCLYARVLVVVLLLLLSFLLPLLNGGAVYKQ